RLAGEALVDRGVEAAHLVHEERRERRNRRLARVGLPGLQERVVVAGPAVVLADELLREVDLAAAVVGGLVPEPVLVGRSERVDDHEDAVRIDRELFLPVHVDQAARTDLLLYRRVDLEDRLPDPVELLRVERGERERLRGREQAVDRLELRRDLEMGLGERDTVRERLPLREAERL